MMKHIIIFLIFILSLTTLADYRGVSFWDLGGEYRAFNSWIRKDKNGFKDYMASTDYIKVEEIFDSNYLDETYGTTFYKGVDQNYYFVIYTYNLADKKIDKIEDMIHLNKVHFRVDVDLYKRMVILEDQLGFDASIPLWGKLKLVFPIAHGGFTLNEAGVSTPQWKNVFIPKSTIISERWKPEYYQGKPFIRVMKSLNIKQGWTGIGFHRRMNKYLRRSPDSHGCMRLREWDLDTMHAIFKYHAKDFHWLSIYLTMPENWSEHPYKMHDKTYKRVKNFGTVMKPISQRGEDGLIIYETIQGDGSVVMDSLI